jgi:hypothetical protein
MCGGVVDQRNQVHLLRPALLQPRMDAGVPLHQLATAGPPRAPAVNLPNLARPGFPEFRPNHQLSQRLPADCNAELAFQLLGRQRRPEIPIAAFHHLDRPLRIGIRHSPVRSPASQRVHQRLIALLPIPLKQLAKSSLRHAEQLRCKRLLQLTSLHLLQYPKPISFSLAHCQPLLFSIRQPSLAQISKQELSTLLY